MGRVALIDGDEVAYAASLRSQRRWWKAIDVRNNTERFRCRYKDIAVSIIEGRSFIDLELEIEELQPELAIEAIEFLLRECLVNSGSTSLQVLFNGGDIFRYKIASIKPYKEGRKSKPKNFRLVKQYLHDNYSTLSLDYLESDDLLAIAQLNSSTETVICSSDKDLNMVEGMRYDIRKKKFLEISPEEAELNFYIQLLTGDSTDNIPGLKGFGEITARKVLVGLSKEERFPFIVNTYKDHIENERSSWCHKSMDYKKVIWEIGNLLWMRRDTGVDAYWNPFKDEKE